MTVGGRIALLYDAGAWGLPIPEEAVEDLVLPVVAQPERPRHRHVDGAVPLSMQAVQ